MNKEENKGVVIPTKKTIKIEENWKELCKNCHVLKLQLGCGYGCEIVRIWENGF
jgi:hypothetical protein